MSNNDQKQQIKQLQEQVAELDNKWKRALADYQNLEKRIETQQANYIRMASVSVIDKLLPIVDDLERAALHIEDNGLQMILNQFHEVLSSEGVTKVDALNKEFDPALMDCVEMTAGKKNVVVKVQQDGYMIGETVIRPAKVEVGNGSKQAQTKNN